MPLQRPKWAEHERVDDVDLNRGSDMPLANLTLALRHFLAPTFGIYRGGRLLPAGGMFCTLSGMGAVGADGAGTGTIVLESGQTVGPFAANNGGSPRTDVVSIRYQETPQSEARQFINPDTDTEYTDADAEVLIQSAPVVVITAGSSTVPAGDLGIATVTIAPGQTVIAGGDIVALFRDRVHPLQVKGLGLITANLPWTSPVILNHRPRGLFSSIFIASAEIDCSVVPTDVALWLEITNGDVPIGSCVFVVPPQAAAIRRHTAIAIGVDGADTGLPREYGLQLRREDSQALAGVTIREATLAVLNLATMETVGV